MTNLKNKFVRALFIGSILAAASFSQAGAAQKASVGLNLNSNSVSKGFIASQIRSQAATQGVKLSSREVNSAAQNAINKMQGNGTGPQKGKIRVELKRFTICVAWGRHKGQCS